MTVVIVTIAIVSTVAGFKGIAHEPDGSPPNREVEIGYFERPMTSSVTTFKGEGKVTAQTNELDEAHQILSKICLVADDVPGFRVINAGQSRSDPQWGVILMGQGFQRDLVGERDGKDPTTIHIDTIMAPDPSTARRTALKTSDTPGGGLPRRSLSGLPLGEMCWSSAEGIGSGSLVALDGNCVVYARAMYTGVPHPSRFSASSTYAQPLTQEDAQLVERAVRLILARYARYNLLGQKGSPAAGLLVRGQRVSAQNVGGIIVSPAKELLERLGIKPRPNEGLLTVSGRYKQKEVLIAVGAREILVGNRKVELPCPVMLDGDQPLVPVEALAKTLAIKTQREKKSGALMVG